MADENYETMNTLSPIASCVHLSLGVMALILVSRAKEREWNERLAGYTISWILIFLGLQYLFVSVIEYRVTTRSTGVYNNYGDEVFYTFLTYAQRSFECGTTIGLAVLPLVYPFPLIQRKSVAKILGIAVLVLGLFMIPFDIFTEFSYRNVRNLPWLIGLVVWTAIYVRFLFGEMIHGESDSRNVSSVAALLLLAWNGKWFMFWLIQLSGQSNIYKARFMVEDFIDQTRISGAAEVGLEAFMCASFLTLFFGEMWRAYKKGSSGIAYITGGLFGLGVIWYLLTLVYMDNITSCVERSCDLLSVAWINFYVVTFQSVLYIGVPLLVMYVMLKYNIVETDSGTGRIIGRTTGLLLILVTSSTLIELIQLILPVPEMITSAVFAAGVVAFIGWEEKFMSQLTSGSKSVSESIRSVATMPKFNIAESEYRFFSMSMMVLCAYAFVISFLFDVIGIHQ